MHEIEFDGHQKIDFGFFLSPCRLVSFCVCGFCNVVRGVVDLSSCAVSPIQAVDLAQWWNHRSRLQLFRMVSSVEDAETKRFLMVEHTLSAQHTSPHFKNPKMAIQRVEGNRCHFVKGKYFLRNFDIS